ncbi:MAG: hypothetical protein ACAI38_05050 [Myxococcota bacterium]
MRLSPHERVSATQRATEAELGSLRRVAQFERMRLALRDIVDPEEKISRAATWRARALRGFDAETGAAAARNQRCFVVATTGIVHDIGTLSPWLVEPPLVREGREAASLLPKINLAFEQAAAGVRATIVRKNGLLGLTLPGEQAPRRQGEHPAVQSRQLPRLVRVTGRNAT